MWKSPLISSAGLIGNNAQRLPQEGSIERLVLDVLHGQKSDLETLLKSRSGPVTLEEIDGLSTQLRKLNRPFLTDHRNIQNPEMVLSEIRGFGQRRKVLADYRQILHNLRQMQHRAESLSRAKAQYDELRDRSHRAAADEVVDIKERMAFWKTAMSRDQANLDEIEARLADISPLSLKDLRDLIREPDAEQA